MLHPMVSLAYSLTVWEVQGLIPRPTQHFSPSCYIWGSSDPGKLPTNRLVHEWNLVVSIQVTVVELKKKIKKKQGKKECGLPDLTGDQLA